MKDIIHCRLIEWYLIFAVLRGLVYQRSVKCPDDDIIAAIFITLLQYTQLVSLFSGYILKIFLKSLSVKIKKYENFFLIMLSIWWALFLYFEKYMYDTDSIFGYTDAKFVSFNHVFYDINNILCLTPINRLLFSSKPGHSFDVYCYSRLLVGFFLLRLFSWIDESCCQSGCHRKQYSPIRSAVISYGSILSGGSVSLQCLHVLN